MHKLSYFLNRSSKSLKYDIQCLALLLSSAHRDHTSTREEAAARGLLHTHLFQRVGLDDVADGCPASLTPDSVQETLCI